MHVLSTGRAVPQSAVSRPVRRPSRCSKRASVLQLDGGEDYRLRGDYRWGDYAVAPESEQGARVAALLPTARLPSTI